MRVKTFTPHSLSGFEPLFERFFSDSGPFFRMAPSEVALSNGASRIPADLFEDEANFYARLEMPGVKRDGVKVEMDGDYLDVSFDRVEGEGSATLHRQLGLPEGIDGGLVSAALADGILTITLPKAEGRKPRTIEVI